MFIITKFMETTRTNNGHKIRTAPQPTPGSANNSIWKLSLLSLSFFYFHLVLQMINAKAFFSFTTSNDKCKSVFFFKSFFPSLMFPTGRMHAAKDWDTRETLMSVKNKNIHLQPKNFVINKVQ